MCIHLYIYIIYTCVAQVIVSNSKTPPHFGLSVLYIHTNTCIYICVYIYIYFIYMCCVGDSGRHQDVTAPRLFAGGPDGLLQVRHCSSVRGQVEFGGKRSLYMYICNMCIYISDGLLNLRRCSIVRGLYFGIWRETVLCIYIHTCMYIHIYICGLE